MSEEQETGWVSALIKCDLCAYKSLSVHHISCDRLECANCGYMSYFEVLKYYKQEE
jgi:ribosomal protein S27AE